MVNSIGKEFRTSLIILHEEHVSILNSKNIQTFKILNNAQRFQYRLHLPFLHTSDLYIFPDL